MAKVPAIAFLWSFLMSCLFRASPMTGTVPGAGDTMEMTNLVLALEELSTMGEATVQEW